MDSNPFSFTLFGSNWERIESKSSILSRSAISVTLTIAATGKELKVNDFYLTAVIHVSFAATGKELKAIRAPAAPAPPGGCLPQQLGKN
jgi:hypothetical protein